MSEVELSLEEEEAKLKKRLERIKAEREREAEEAKQAVIAEAQKVGIDPDVIQATAGDLEALNAKIETAKLAEAETKVQTDDAGKISDEAAAAELDKLTAELSAGKEAIKA